jgi:hypothetical protein
MSYTIKDERRVSGRLRRVVGQAEAEMVSLPGRPLASSPRRDGRLPITVDGFEWLDAFGQRAADQVFNNREAEKVVVGHADWYAGNMAVINGQLATEAVIAGFTSCLRRARPAVAVLQLVGQGAARAVASGIAHQSAITLRRRDFTHPSVLPPRRGRALLCGQLK